MENIKTRLKIVTLGHVDSGKSSTLGHLLYKCGIFDERVMEKVTEQAEQIGKRSFRYSWIFSKLKSEREKGLTIFPSNLNFNSNKQYYTIIDAPGHKHFIKYTIDSILLADAAVLFISAGPGEFEIGFNDKGQTREHIDIAQTMGIKQIIIAINKLDLVNYDKDSYHVIKNQVSDYLKKIGFNEPDINFVACSGLVGDNLVEKLNNMPWYEGDTLLEAMDKLKSPPKQTDKPLRIPIQDLFQIGEDHIAVSKVETGVLKKGMPITIAPSGAIRQCGTIEENYIYYNEAIPGDNTIGIHLEGVNYEISGKGCVIGNPDNNPPREAISFIAQIQILDTSYSEIVAGFTPIIDCHKCFACCRFEKFISKIDKFTGEEIEAFPEQLKYGDCAIVEMVPKMPMVVEVFEEFPTLGRFYVKEMKMVVAFGVIKSVERKNI
jgi:elongation factor 1-alpha